MINITFSEFVKMNGRLWEVNFRKLTRGIFVFYADTTTLQGERIQFQLQREEGAGWQISGNHLTEWLTESVQNLGSAIERGLQEYYPQISGDKAEMSV